MWKLIAISVLLFSLGIIYAIHANHEYQGSVTDANNGDATASFIKLAEFYFFLPIAIIHFILIPWILKKKYSSQVPYLIIIFGTISIFVIYMFSKDPDGPGVPIVHLDTTTDWKDLTSKILQACLLPLAGYMLHISKTKKP
jgi:glucan phosphoethanolaminetransferase (alkaline phosphatase superfamily)